MNKNIKELLELNNLINLYNVNRNFVLIIIICLFILIMIFIVFLLNKKYHINKRVDFIKIIIYKVTFPIFTLLIIGNVLHYVGVNFSFRNENLPILIFIYTFFPLLIIQSIEFVRYKSNNFEILINTIDIICVVIELEVLFLAIIDRLEVIEFLTALISILSLKIIKDYYRELKVIREELPIDEVTIKIDVPINDERNLFDSRKRQLDVLCRELNTKSIEPFAVVISGEWGSGKTSLINILKNKLEDAEFIEVECSLENDIKSILDDIALQIQEIFDKNKFYVGRNSRIEKYFKKVGELVGDIGYSNVTKIINRLNKNTNTTFLENKKEINRELKHFYRMKNKRIYIIVDNMDRILDEKTKSNIFQVIRESVNLNNCATLFMVDYEKLVNKDMSREFLEKYVNYKVSLCEINFEEIVEKYLDTFFQEEFWIDKSEYIVNKGKNLKNNLIEKSYKIVEKLQEKISSLENELSNAKENEKEKLFEKLNYLKRAEIRLQKRMKNPRKIKRFLKDIENMLTLEDIVWFQFDNLLQNDYSKEDWVEITFQLSFIKCFLNEEYDAMILAKSLDNFQQDYEHSIVVDAVLDGYYTNNELTLIYSYRKSKTENVINMLLYRLYALNVQTDKTRQQIYLEELQNDNIKEENLSFYINECFQLNYDLSLLNKIINYINKHDFKYSINLKNNILDLVQLIFSNDSLYWGCPDIYKKLKIIIDSNICKKLFTKKEKREIYERNRIFKRKLLYHNMNNISMILGIVFESNIKLPEYIDTAQKLYDFIVKNNQEYPQCEVKIIETDNYLVTLKNYFDEIEKEFDKEKYKRIKKELISMIKKIKDMVDFYLLWNDDFLNDKNLISNIFDEEENKLKEEVLDSVENLNNVLEEMRNYAGNEKDTAKYFEIFLVLLFNLEEKVINKKLKIDKNIVDKLYKLYEDFEKDNKKTYTRYGDSWKIGKIIIFKIENMI